MLSTQALREQLDRYAEGVLSPEALEEWLASESWDMHRWAPLGVQRLVKNMQAAFIGHSDGDLSSAGLHEFLIARRDQLRRAAEASMSLDEAIRRSIEAADKDKSMAVSEALAVSA